MFPKRVTSLLAALVVASALVSSVFVSSAGAAVRHIDGTIVSKNAGDKSFKLRTQSGTINVSVTSTTIFDRLSGFGALRKGLAVEVDARRTSNGWTATKIEPRSSGGNGGNDDGPGDDHGGSHGGGRDDGPNHT